jgi:hypothetical protein
MPINLFNNQSKLHFVMKVIFINFNQNLNDINHFNLFLVKNFKILLFFIFSLIRISFIN